MKTILAVTSSTSCKIELIVCNSINDALIKMKKMHKTLCKTKYYDYNNTYLDEEEKYAQFVNGIEQIEFRIGEIN